MRSSASDLLSHEFVAKLRLSAFSCALRCHRCHSLHPRHKELPVMNWIVDGLLTPLAAVTSAQSN